MKSASVHTARRQTLFIVGPTASGKTALAIDLARQFGGEIVNADSRAFYRGMNIGTAKPTPEEQGQAVHHLVDVAEPDETCGLIWFLDRADAAIRIIRARGRLPIVAGGTGQYVRALLEGWDVPRVPPDPELRRVLNERAERDGVASLFTELQALDPAAAARVDARNPRRVIRALEIALSAGGAAGSAPSRAPVEPALVLGIRLPRDELYRRIDARVAAMFASGLVEEVRSLNAHGFGCDLPSFSAIGYRQVCSLLRGDLTLEAAVEQTKTATHRLARTQHAWFRPADPRITWLNAGPDLTEQAAAAVRSFLSAGPAETR